MKVIIIMLTSLLLYFNIRITYSLFKFTMPIFIISNLYLTLLQLLLIKKSLWYFFSFICFFLLGCYIVLSFECNCKYSDHKTQLTRACSPSRLSLSNWNKIALRSFCCAVLRAQKIIFFSSYKSIRTGKEFYWD